MLGEGVQRHEDNGAVLAGQCSLAAVPSSEQGVGRAPNTPPPPRGAGCWAGTRDAASPQHPVGATASTHGDDSGPQSLLPGGRPRCVPAAVMLTPMGRDVLALPSAASVIVMGTRSGKQQEASPKSRLPGGLCRQEMIQGSAGTRQKMMLQLPWHRRCRGAAAKEGDPNVPVPGGILSCSSCPGQGAGAALSLTITPSLALNRGRDLERFWPRRAPGDATCSKKTVAMPPQHPSQMQPCRVACNLKMGQGKTCASVLVFEERLGWRGPFCGVWGQKEACLLC